MATQDFTIQQEIITQLGGNKFKMMTGATFQVDSNGTLIVKFKGSRVAKNLM